MYASKLTFSNDFAKKSKKKISTIRKGQLMWERLEEADRNGSLQQACHRSEVGALVGIDSRKKAYTWTVNMINKGAITETLLGFDGTSRVYEYHLGKKPAYAFNGGKRKTQPSAIERPANAIHVPDNPLKVTAKTAPIIEVKDNGNNLCTIIITIDNVSIKAENVDVDFVSALVKKLSGKE